MSGKKLVLYGKVILWGAMFLFIALAAVLYFCQASCGDAPTGPDICLAAWDGRRPTISDIQQDTTLDGGIDTTSQDIGFLPDRDPSDCHT